MIPFTSFWIIYQPQKAGKNTKKKSIRPSQATDATRVANEANLKLKIVDEKLDDLLLIKDSSNPKENKGRRSLLDKPLPSFGKVKNRK